MNTLDYWESVKRNLRKSDKVKTKDVLEILESHEAFRNDNKQLIKVIREVLEEFNYLIK